MSASDHSTGVAYLANLATGATDYEPEVGGGRFVVLSGTPLPIPCTDYIYWYDKTLGVQSFDNTGNTEYIFDNVTIQNIITTAGLLDQTSIDAINLEPNIMTEWGINGTHASVNVTLGAGDAHYMCAEESGADVFNARYPYTITGEVSILSTHIGETSALVMDYPDATSYDTIVGLPAYVTQSTTTIPNDTVTVTNPPTAEHILTDVYVNTATDVKMANLRTSVFPVEANLQTVIDGMTAQTATEKITTLGTIIFTSPQYARNPDGLTWTSIFCYYQGYGGNQQVISINLSDGLVKSNILPGDIPDFENASWHQFKMVPSSVGNKSYTNPPTSGDNIAIHSYDTDTHAWTPNVYPATNDLHKAGAQQSRLTQGTNGRIYSLGVNDGSTEHSILEINPVDDTSRFWSGLAVDGTGGAQTITADDTHAYYTSDTYNATVIRCVELSTGINSVVVNSPVVTGSIIQHRYGVTYGTTGYLYQGVYTPAQGTGINDPLYIPWNGGVDSTDLNELTYAQETPEFISITDENAMVPVDGGDGYFYYKDPADEINWIQITIPNLLTYPENIRKVGIMGNGEVFCETESYSGYSIYDPVGDSIEQFVPVEGRISNYTLIMDNSNDKIYISGYFNTPVFDYDVTQPWDNVLTPLYDPDTDYSNTNPFYAGTYGSAALVSKAFNGCVGADGLLYFCGEKIRSGTGGGVAIYQPLDPGNLDLYINVGLDGHNPRDVVATKDYIVVASYPEAATLPFTTKLTVYTYPTSPPVAFDREIYPDVNITLDAVRLTADSINNNLVYFMSEDDTTKFVRVFKYDVSDGSLIWEQTYDFTASIGGYNDNASTRLMLADDGFLYVTFDSVDTIMRIDPENGNIEPSIKYTGSSMTWFDAREDELYFAGSSVIKSLTAFKAPIITDTNTVPVITLIGEATITLLVDDIYTDTGATAYDIRDGDITANIVTVNPVDTSVAGNYTVTYNVVDSDTNNAIEVTRSIEVLALGANILDGVTPGISGDWVDNLDGSFTVLNATARSELNFFILGPDYSANQMYFSVEVTDFVQSSNGISVLATLLTDFFITSNGSHVQIGTGDNATRPIIRVETGGSATVNLLSLREIL